VLPAWIATSRSGSRHFPRRPPRARARPSAAAPTPLRAAPGLTAIAAPLPLAPRRPEGIRVDGAELRVGGAVTLEAFRLHPLVRKHFPALEADLLLHSSAILRNRATLAGNVVNASPIGDMSIILLALDAALLLEDSAGKSRRVPLDRFYQGYKKFDLACGELVRELAIPLPAAEARYRFEKVSNRVHLDIAAVNCALRFTPDAAGAVADLRLAAGGVAPIPLLVGGMEAFPRTCPSPEGEALGRAAGRRPSRSTTCAARPDHKKRSSAARARGLRRSRKSGDGDEERRPHDARPRHLALRRRHPRRQAACTPRCSPRRSRAADPGSTSPPLAAPAWSRSTRTGVPGLNQVGTS
jgi:CO/xanthine dehydrogenase FAD-binding subunit